MVALHLALLSLTVSQVIGGIDNISNIINLFILINFSTEKVKFPYSHFDMRNYNLFIIVGPSAKQWNAKTLSGLKKKIDRVKSKLEISPERFRGNKKQTMSDDGEGKN